MQNHASLGEISRALGLQPTRYRCVSTSSIAVPYIDSTKVIGAYHFRHHSYLYLPGQKHDSADSHPCRIASYPRSVISGVFLHRLTGISPYRFSSQVVPMFRYRNCLQTQFETPDPRNYARPNIFGRMAIPIIALGSLAMSLGISGCGSQAAAFSSPTSSNAALLVTPASVDFADVTVGSGASKSIAIMNQSTTPLQVNELTSSSSAFTVKTTSLPTTLTPGQTLDAQVRFNPNTTTDSTAQLTITTMSSTSTTTNSSTIKLHGKG